MTNTSDRSVICPPTYAVDGAYLVEPDDVRVFQQLHDLHLPEDLFQVVVIQLGLVHDLYSHLERRQDGEGCVSLPSRDRGPTTNMAEPEQKVLLNAITLVHNRLNDCYYP